MANVVVKYNNRALAIYKDGSLVCTQERRDSELDNQNAILAHTGGDYSEVFVDEPGKAKDMPKEYKAPAAKAPKAPAAKKAPAKAK